MVALGWPQPASGAGGVVAFLQSEGPMRPDLKERVSRRLPPYMVPRRFHCLPAFPLNHNGKYDRKQLALILETIS